MVVGRSATVFTRIFVGFQGCCDIESLTHLRTAAKAIWLAGGGNRISATPLP
jgi:hypothetical protein